MAGFSIAAIGFIGQLVIPHPGLPGLTYGFLFPVAAGLYCPFIQIVCWIGKPLFAAPSHRMHTDGFPRQQPRPFVEARGRHSPADLCRELWRYHIFLAAEKPKYPTGFGTGLGISIAAILMAIVLRISCQRENKRRRDMIEQEGEDAIRARYGEQQLLEMGDKSPFFIYTL
ncbi:hypothetical protein LTR54_014692 [Friedmanniomyces endolithicus]|nr:hypothetical protein LTR54_014692 [Friedmanniomyces endolithicus]